MKLIKPEVSLETQHDWNIALHESWCRYDGGIIYVDEVYDYRKHSAEVIASGYRLTEKKHGGVSRHWFDPDSGGALNAELFDFTPPKSGYFNYMNFAVYTTRLPRRQWRKGLTPHTVMCKSNGDTSFSNSFACAVFKHEHMSIPDAYNAVGNIKTHMSAAFSDNYAFVEKKSLIPDTVFIAYKGDIIGVVDDSLVATIPVEVEFLKEELSQYLEVDVL